MRYMPWDEWVRSPEGQAHVAELEARKTVMVYGSNPERVSAIQRERMRLRLLSKMTPAEQMAWHVDSIEFVTPLEFEEGSG